VKTMPKPEPRYRITNLGRGLQDVRNQLKEMGSTQLESLEKACSHKQFEALENGSPSITLRTLASIANCAGLQLKIEFQKV